MKGKRTSIKINDSILGKALPNLHASFQDERPLLLKNNLFKLSYLKSTGKETLL